MPIPPRLRLLLGLLTALAVTAACGQASTGSPSAGSVPSPASTAATAPGAGADPGPGAAFAPAGSLLYIRTPGAGPAWDALSTVRARVRGLRNFDPTQSLGNLMRLLTAADFAGGPAAMVHSLTGESSEVLISRRTVKAEDGSDAADTLFYSQVSDHATLERWIASYSVQAGSDGDFALFRGKGRDVSYSALSPTVWLWANSLDTLRRSIATAGGNRPSLLADPDFIAALAGLDGSNAALVGYTRGDLAAELRGLFIPSVDPDRTSTSLTDALGLADTAFAVGANDHGVWMRAAPHALATGYGPGPIFTPTLIGQAPANAIAYVGVRDGSSQLPGFDRVLAPLMGSSDGPGRAFVEGLVGRLYGITPRDLAAIGHGEQAWFVGQASGAAFRPRDPAHAEAALSAVAARGNPGGFRSGRDGDVVWLRGPRWPGKGLSGPSVAELVAHAGITHPVSWVAAINLGFLTGLRSETDTTPSVRPQDSAAGAVVSTAPGTGGRYRLELFLEIDGS